MTTRRTTPRRSRGGSFSQSPHRLDGSYTHESLHTEPSFRALHASHAQTAEGLAHEYNPTVRPSRGRPIRQGRGTTAAPYWPEPLEYGPNYHHNLSHGHFAEGGAPLKRSRGRSPTINPHDGHPGYGLLSFLNDVPLIGGITKMLGFAEGGHAASGHSIQQAVQHPGSLHKALKVPKNKKISAPKLEKASHSKNPLMRKRATLALTLKGFHHKG